jgi:thioester reductase-like protein
MTTYKPQTSQVSSVLLLVRRNRHQTAQQRVQTLLCGPVFHTLHKQVASGGTNVFQKVHVIEGDLTQPGLGLSDADRQLVLQQTNMVLHAAADLALQAPIQRTLG